MPVSLSFKRVLSPRRSLNSRTIVVMVLMPSRSSSQPLMVSHYGLCESREDNLLSVRLTMCDSLSPPFCDVRC